MKVYSAEAVHAALPWGPLVDALEAGFQAGASVPLRHAHVLSGQDALLLMPAWNSEVVVLKQATVIPSAPVTVQATLVVSDRRSGKPLAVLDGEALTLRRTAATSALAARHLARTDSQTLLVVGTGQLAGWMARAHAALRPTLRHVRVWGRRPQAAMALARSLADEGLPAQAAVDLETAVRNASIVCCATSATEPLVRGSWLAEGTHLDLVGAYKKSMREVDDEALLRARVVVDTYTGALAEAGDLVQPMARGVFGREHVTAELAELVRGQRVGREDARQITAFKSVGSALEDLAAAQLVVKSGA